MIAIFIDRVYCCSVLRRQCDSITCKHFKSINELRSSVCFAKERESQLIYVMRVQLCDHLAERLELGQVGHNIPPLVGQLNPDQLFLRSFFRSLSPLSRSTLRSLRSLSRSTCLLTPRPR